jgi:hypothetical protein
MHDPINAFVPGPRVRIESAPEGPLRGLTFAAKDLFDVTSHPISGGNLDWGARRGGQWAANRSIDRGWTRQRCDIGGSGTSNGGLRAPKQRSVRFLYSRRRFAIRRTCRFTLTPSR